MAVDDKPPAASRRRRPKPLIPLACGDPENEATPASFSRFALPFAYQLASWPGSCPRGLFFEPESLDSEAQAARLRYLTSETADVLFRRAGWFRLTGGADSTVPWQQFSVPFLRRSGQYTVEIKPPQLVLFELAGAPPKDEQTDLLATGFLLIDLFFPDPGAAPGLAELIELNELFRYWHQPFRGHAERGSATGRSYLQVLAELPLEIGQGSSKVGNAWPFDPYLDRWLSLLKLPIQLDNTTYRRLFSDDWHKASETALKNPGKSTGPSWLAYADSRAFVWTCAIVEGGLESLPAMWGVDGAAGRGHWVKLLNVDPPGTEPKKTTPFEREWAASRTYHRWEDSGTVYGFTYHSGALLAPPDSGLPLHRHFAEQYFDQVLLLLYLRVTSFRFSRALSEMTGRARSQKDGEEKAWWRDFGALRKEFAFFTNLYQFPLISNQQQGVELYALAREQLDVEKLFREIQAEVQSTHDYFEIEAAKDQNALTNRLTLTASVGLAIGVVTGILGMNVISPLGWRRDLLMVFAGILFAILLFRLVNYHTGAFSKILALPESLGSKPSRRNR